MADNRPIGVFDSGLGGLTVVRELIKAMPFENIVYFGDTGRVPYGTRSPETIFKYTKQDESFLLSQDVKMIVAACGTVSSVASQTGDLLPVPFVEVVTHAAKKAAEITKNGRIGVIATSATIKSNSYKKHINSLMPSAEVYQNDCPLFVPLVEAGWVDRNDIVTIETAKRYLQPLKDVGVYVLIMGCTHYPVITDIIRDIMGEEVTLINTGEYTAKFTKELLDSNKMETDSNTHGICKYFVSDKTEVFSKTASILMGSDFCGDVSEVDIHSIKELF